METVKGKIISVNISEKKGIIKTPKASVTIDANGIVGDAHAGAWHRQISLLGLSSIEKFEAKAKREINAGEFAENFTVGGIDIMKTAVLDRFKIGEVELEVTQLGKKCHGDNCAIYREVGNCVMPKEGIFCRVIKGGIINAGDEIVWQPQPLNITILTLSDRASRGEYEDKSGPKAQEMIMEYFETKRWHINISQKIIPDDADLLKTELDKARKGEIDILFTTGGTGVSSRDITPDVILKEADKTLDGIMDFIRFKYGATNPKALLSRSVAAIINKTQVFALPGSVRAVEEYVTEILPILEHQVIMLHDIDGH
ncbi:MAG: molybdopterin-binding protein [Alphaproteobacteria bacterium]